MQDVYGHTKDAFHEEIVFVILEIHPSLLSLIHSTAVILLRVVRYTE
jgi:hypothetical protein